MQFTTYYAVVAVSHPKRVLVMLHMTGADRHRSRSVRTEVVAQEGLQVPGDHGSLRGADAGGSSGCGGWWVEAAIHSISDPAAVGLSEATAASVILSIL